MRAVAFSLSTWLGVCWGALGVVGRQVSSAYNPSMEAAQPAFPGRPTNTQASGPGLLLGHYLKARQEIYYTEWAAVTIQT